MCVCVWGRGGGVYNIVGVSEREEGRATSQRVKLPHSKNTPSHTRSKGIAFE